MHANKCIYHRSSTILELEAHLSCIIFYINASICFVRFYLVIIFYVFSGDLINVAATVSGLCHGKHMIYASAPERGKPDGYVHYSADDGMTWAVLKPAVIRAGPSMFSGMVLRGCNISHVRLGVTYVKQLGVVYHEGLYPLSNPLSKPTSFV